MLFDMENRNTAYMTLGLIAQMIRGFIVGNVIIGVILGISSTIAFWILGVPYFYVIGMISGVVSLLPYLGIVLAILPPVVVSMGALTAPGFAAIVSFVAISHVIALNVLYPKIIGRRLDLNPLAVTLALLFWGWLWGAMGLLLAVPSRPPSRSSLTMWTVCVPGEIGWESSWTQGAWAGTASELPGSGSPDARHVRTAIQGGNGFRGAGRAKSTSIPVNRSPALLLQTRHGQYKFVDPL